MGCLSYSKSIKLKVLNQVIITVGPLLGLVHNCKIAAEVFPVGLNDVAKRVKAAAGMCISIPCV